MFENKIAVLGLGTVVAAGLVAAVVALLPGEPTSDKPVALATSPAQTQQPAAAPTPAPQQEAKVESPASLPAATAPAAQPQGEATITSSGPTFDILRVEPSGSIVVAGKAAKNATVDLLSGSQIVGTGKATDTGDFVIALDTPLKPGDYQLVLRSTLPDGSALTSLETAIVSIPENKSGQVLALVEQSGQPSRMITTPQATAPAAPAEAQTAMATAASPAGDKPAAPAERALVAVEAVEIEGNKIFIAGTSEPGSTVKLYANDDPLGTTKTAPNGRFLLQTVQELAVGDYIIRAEMMGRDGMTIIARAAVPFKREAGERVAAIADATPGDSATGAVPQGTDPAAQNSEAPLKNVDGSVIIRRGDNLWRISRRTYGAGVRYTTIYLANKEQIRNPNKIFPGQVFTLPDQEKSAVE
ncbi:Nucleoid-associated protein YgaU, contains BON and LysM domains [Phyllobacterium sp. YR620]|uniref:LysM peptidoglycan-binding domain-containing protein n=1 Tax=Phyllobacterium sp. YR620 TaxID=1881066 RepID=UPI000883D6D3|nr:LysM peptidoglycan-binding domain-containing protein [Phyllobacterium sp. YR620]SDP56753.1 Nucleoid-associated protein YgaU, contains BON and LysM domains [Phyllobacterium sp. YR620]